MSDLRDHVARNRVHWDALAPQYADAGERAWAKAEPAWGIWQIPETELQLLPERLAGKDAIELGCGTAYVSAWLARRGARVVGIDNSEAQLATARRLQRQHGSEFPLLHGDAEAVPYPDASFDLAISEYGACLWADPQRWVPEAERLLRPAFGMCRVGWPDTAGVEFHLAHGDWIRLLRGSGFEVEGLIEPRPAPGATSLYAFVTPG